jgi:hypothetical protein
MEKALSWSVCLASSGYSIEFDTGAYFLDVFRDRQRETSDVALSMPACDSIHDGIDTIAQT